MSVLIGHSLNRAVEWFDSLRERGIDITASAATKARKEAQEFEATPTLEEGADVVIAVMGALHAQGFSTVDLGYAIFDKMQVNEGRTWEQMTDGTWQHK